MISDNEREAMDAVNSEDGFAGVVQHIMTKDECSKEVATEKAIELGYSEGDVAEAANDSSEDTATESNLEEDGNSDSEDGSVEESAEETSEETEDEGEKVEG